ncbi:uncharacterized protein LOC122049654 [Zingiber officinale]|uniref:uncharacterized protein LOC122049654 n=1 Tax=Zingiber officinale TaxID=94328 RepID=UPI001C4CC62D|nr:uncharacterized protein LOC122049654 [Zingiber officinale]
MELKEDASTSAGGGGGAVRRSPTKVRIIETQYVQADKRDFKWIVQRLTGKESSTTATAVAGAENIALDVAADRGTAAASTTGTESKKNPAVAGVDGGVEQGWERGAPADCSFIDELMEMLRD